MMQTNTGLKILKRYAHTTGRGEKSQSASRRIQTSIAFGGRRTSADNLLTQQLHGLYAMGNWYGIPALDVENKNPSLTMRITTNLLMLFGYVNHVTKNVIKKLI